MKIENKIESIKKIKALGFNTFAEQIIDSKDKDRDEKLLNFIKENPAKFYTLRDKSKTGGKAFHAVTARQVLEASKVYESGPFAILESSYNYKSNQKLVGEILIKGENVWLIASTCGEHSIRDVYNSPSLIVNTSLIDDKTLNKIPYFDEIYKFLYDKNLIGVVVEFGYFDIKVGINKENIIIYEIRTDY